MFSLVRFSLVLLAAFSIVNMYGESLTHAETSVVKKKRKKKASKKLKTSVELSVEARSGGFSGDITNRYSGVFELVTTRARAVAEAKDWRLQVPVVASDKRSAFATQDESAGSLGVRLRYKKTRKLAVTLRADVAGRWRGNWVDQYQPVLGGELGTTDRYSRWRRKVGVDVALTLKKKHHAKLSYFYEVYDYQDDPNFNPMDAPTHIVPGDREVHGAKFKWMHWGKKTKLGGGLNLYHQRSLFAFARDARNGKTHAAAGGLPPNPLQVLVEAEPYLTWEFGRIKDRWQLDLSYGVIVVSDRFEGYYSSLTQHPQVKLAVKTSESGKMKASTSVFWKRYGENSYQATGNRPELDYGDRRVNRKANFDLSYEHQLNGHWRAVASAKAVIRRTNYPDYVPNVYPSNRAYSIHWDYNNFVASVGVEWHL